MLEGEIAMGKLLSGFILPMLLLSAAILNWSLISLADLLSFLYVQYNAPKIGLRSRRRSLISWCTLFISSLAVLSNAIFQFVRAVKGDQWTDAGAEWAEKIGFIGVQSWNSPDVKYFLLLQISKASVAAIEIRWSRYGSDLRRTSWLRHLYSSLKQIGSHLRVLCYFSLPALRLAVGISRPSWTSFPFFICSCIGLINWSLTSNFLGLYRWSRYLLMYAGLNISLLYVYQLPIDFSGTIGWVASFIGLHKLSTQSEWSEICSSMSLLFFYITLSWIRCDLMEMDFIMSTRESTLTEPLLPPKHSFLIHQSRSGVRHTNVLLRRAVFRTFSVNFFTYGFPISLLALSFWSFHFASVCAFGLLAYVGYILYAFPSLFHLHHLNGLLLVFILLWTASTYVFNVAFTVLDKKVLQDMQIWETIGLWHYSTPGFYLLAQFGLGVLVSLVNLVNNSVFVYLSDGERQFTNDNCISEDREETEVLIVATIAWGLRKISRAIALVLIFLVALKPGFIHSVYIVFFMKYLLSHNISWKMRQFLVILCEMHFALLYVLRFKVVLNILEQKASLAKEILFQLGFIEQATTGDLLKIAALACFCTLQNHGLGMLSSFSAIIQHTPCPPVGFSILKAGLMKSVLLSVYTSRSKEKHDNTLHEGRVASYLSAIGQKFLRLYRSCGTYIASLTILSTVYTVRPNLMSSGYIFFLLLWMNGRQLLGKTKKRLWLPLKIYSVLAFIMIYGLSVFSFYRTWLFRRIDIISVFGYNHDSTVLGNVWNSLAVLVVMQLYSYERRRSKHLPRIDDDQSEFSSFSLMKRLSIIHCDKILNIAVLYASLSPLSAIGLLYVCGLVVSATLPKSSWISSRMFMLYSGCLLMVEYLFQLWGEHVEMFPGQKHYQLSLLLGLRLYEPGFLGLESGLRGKVLVIASCSFQYNVFFWLKNLKHSDRSPGKWEELCPLFCVDEAPSHRLDTEVDESKLAGDASSMVQRKMEGRSYSWPFLSSLVFQVKENIPSDVGGFEGNNKGKQSYILGNSKDGRKGNRKRMHMMRKERLHLQITAAKLFLRFWAENMFSIFGLEINMVVLLLTSFAVLNSVSLLYVTSLAACIILPRPVIQRWWPVFVTLFGSTFILEYLAIWLDMTSLKQQESGGITMPCRDCWRSSQQYFDHCKKCWFGIILDDPRMLISYYVVFALACFKLRADHFSSLSATRKYQKLSSQYKKAYLNDLSTKTKLLWTFLDYARLYSYCHLLDLVLTLVLITGTLEFDILHLGYLGFALLFFRMRLQILKKKNKIFKFLRMYNFAVIILSLAYQSPFVGSSCEGECGMSDYISETIGFYKYDYGFRITSRSALVEIVIYMLVSLQSFMFSSEGFDYVSEYLEAEQISMFVREQENKAAWKTAHLQELRKSREEKRLRNLQVEKMKSEMLNLQTLLHNMTIGTTYGNANESEGARSKRRNSAPPEEDQMKSQSFHLSSEFIFPFDILESPASDGGESSLLASRKPSLDLSYDVIPSRKSKAAFHDYVVDARRVVKRVQVKKNPFSSTVHLFSDGLSEARSLCKMGVTSIVNFFNIKHEFSDADYESSDDEVYYDIENINSIIELNQTADRTFSFASDAEQTTSDNAYQQMGMIFRYMWAKMQSNNDVVCYCCFILVFLWNFSLYSMVYPAVLFLYALCINTGPKNLFWFIMLVYTEGCISVQYIYQIVIQQCGMAFTMSLLQELGFPAHKIKSSFVISNWPLFLVYLFTLLQTSITARDSKWTTSKQSHRDRRNKSEEHAERRYARRIEGVIFSAKHFVDLTVRSLSRYWKSLTRGAETPPYFVQLSMKVGTWPEDGIQPDRITSGINKMLKIVHEKRFQEKRSSRLELASSVRVQSIERSPDNVSVCLVVFEVLYAAPLKECKDAESYQSLTPAADVATEILEGERAGILRHIGFPYSVISVIGGGKREVDLYAYVFCADLAVFFLVAIFYQSVMKNKSEFLEVYQLEDQFPKEFVFILMVIFFLIVLDRIIYLCSFATGKVIFYLFNFSLFTYSVTSYAWYIGTKRNHAGKFALRAVYLTKAISLALQAVQIRFGVPHESTLYRQFLTSSISRVNYLGFRMYRALPFLYELRCVLDWSCTATSLTMYDWLKLEDMHASLFLVKCDADLNRAMHKQGEKQTKMTKFCNGICLFFILMCVIWAPMLMYSSGNPTNIANPIKDASIKIDMRTVSGRLTLFETTLCERISYDELEEHNDLDPNGYLSAYNNKDVQLICCQADASNLWLVPPVVQERYMMSLNMGMDIIFYWQLTRDRPKGKEVVRYEMRVQDEDLPSYSDVMEVLNGSSNSFTIYNVYPRYLRVTGSGDVRPLEPSVVLVSGDLVLNRGNPEWWSFHDIDSSSGCGMFSGPTAVFVSEETPQGIIGDTLSKFSIWGLYLTFVLAVGRFIRLQCADIRMRIPYENLPSCDRLLAICEDIYAARAEGELEVEEVLYWTLVKIYRSPHMLLEYTKLD